MMSKGFAVFVWSAAVAGWGAPAEVDALREEMRGKGWIAYAAKTDGGDLDIFLCRPDGGGASPVLALGDSFLRIFELDEPGKAGFISHLSHSLAMPVDRVINDGGASTLVRQELCRRPDLLAGKRVVVWTFVERDLRLGAERWQAVKLRSQ